VAVRIAQKCSEPYPTRTLWLEGFLTLPASGTSTGTATLDPTRSSLEVEGQYGGDARKAMSGRAAPDTEHAPKRAALFALIDGSPRATTLRLSFQHCLPNGTTRRTTKIRQRLPRVPTTRRGGRAPNVVTSGKRGFTAGRRGGVASSAHIPTAHGGENLRSSTVDNRALYYRFLLLRHAASNVIPASRSEGIELPTHHARLELHRSTLSAAQRVARRQLEIPRRLFIFVSLFSLARSSRHSYPPAGTCEQWIRERSARSSGPTCRAARLPPMRFVSSFTLSPTISETSCGTRDRWSISSRPLRHA
jgi:hypothetical protein